jgi:Zn-dependent protease with chaperone function
MEAGSLIGFGLAFLSASALASLICAGVLFAFRRRLRLAGPAAQRKASSWALVLPPLSGLAVTVALIGHSALGRWLGEPDHCAAHAHHLHLCLYHGAGWLTHTWAVVALVVVGTVAVVRASARTFRMRAAHQAIRTLGRMSRRPDSGHQGDEICIVPANRHFCFCAGLRRPRIFVSSASWARLDAPGREAVIAHERAHVRQGDVWRRFVLGLLSLVGAPGVTTLILRLWHRATERLCDREAARVVGDPTVVARALVDLSGARAPRALPAFVSGDDIVQRVEALLAGEPDGVEAARRVHRAALVASVLTTLAALVSADPLHHAFETLLGMM